MRGGWGLKKGPTEGWLVGGLPTARWGWDGGRFDGKSTGGCRLCTSQHRVGAAAKQRGEARVRRKSESCQETSHAHARRRTGQQKRKSGQRPADACRHGPSAVADEEVVCDIETYWRQEQLVQCVCGFIASLWWGQRRWGEIQEVERLGPASRGGERRGRPSVDVTRPDRMRNERWHSATWRLPTSKSRMPDKTKIAH